ncbi:MAG: DegT/DnrJ/EryC1/StrS family aminotransferase, partial [Ignavibacteria bacterium]|nr:DegT/DnrJ/EryC1/StrS family aminotransferase [Ignavibacteria bacterium]
REMKAKKDWQAWDRRGITFDQEEMGYKYQPTDIDASIGLVALETFDDEIRHRHELVRLYRTELRNSKFVTLLRKGYSSDWLFMVLVNGDRDKFASYLLDKGIETNVAHIRNDLFKVFGGRREKLPNMNKIEFKYLCLPLNSKVIKEDVLYICKMIQGFK